MSRIDKRREFVPVNIAILTVSDSRTPADDRSGDTLVARLTKAGHILAARAIVVDERDTIAAQLRAWIADPGIDAIISTGGTGLTGRDVTVEAHRPARLARRLQGRLGRDPVGATRLPPHALQLRRDHAPAGGAQAAQMKGGAGRAPGPAG